jgi:outer membrane protein OmpA-like peptidoglycan-associated protein/tetratricopeptide (TPR) repeat protein
MKSLRFAAAIAILGCSYSQGWTQPINSLPTSKKIEIANNNATKKDTYNALEWYIKAHQDDPKNVDLIYNIAYTYDQLRDYPNAASWYEKLASADKDKKYALARFYYAQSLKKNCQYEKAITEFRAFSTEYKGDNAERYQKLASIEIEGAQYARQNPEPFERIVVQRLDSTVNSYSTEGTAYPIGRNRLVYSSLRADTIIYVEEVGEELKFARLYETNRNSDTSKWEQAKPYSANTLAKKDHHFVHPAYSPDMKFFYFTYATLKGNALENSQIHVADNSSGTPSNPRLLDFNSTAYSCKNPQVATFEGKMYLLFSSDMPGGKGGYDIWYAEINPDGSTKQPLNLGPVVNSLGDDITPFFDERDQNLYFSSDGHPSIGGLDVFKVARKNGEWTKVENMGQGFNSCVDDFGFIVNKVDNDDCYGYLVSNRKGTMSLKSATCCDDLFSILMPSRCDVICKVNLTDSETNQPLNGVTVQLVDKSTGKVVDEQTNKEGNNFTFILEQNKDYEFRTSKPDYEGASVTVSTTPKEVGEITRPIELGKMTAMKPLPKGLVVEVYDAETQQPLNGVSLLLADAGNSSEVGNQTQEAGNKFTFPAVDRKKSYRIDAKRQGYQNETRSIESSQISGGQVVKVFLTPLKLPIFYNVYFDFNKSNIRPGAEDTLKMVLKTLKDYSQLVVEVRGHADAIGSNNYNDGLSARRSKSTIDYLANNGVDRSRMVLKALGENEPAADNMKDGKDNPEGRQLNRRVEFKIIDAKDLKTTPEPSKPATGTTSSNKWQNKPAAPTTTATTTTAANSQNRPKTKLQFVQKSPLSLGTLKFGEKKVHTIEYTNTGKNEFVAEFVSGSCECTKILDYSRKVAPGQKGFVKIEFDSKKASVKKGYSSGIEILGNTEGDQLTLYNMSVDITN